MIEQILVAPSRCCSLIIPNDTAALGGNTLLAPMTELDLALRISSLRRNAVLRTICASDMFSLASVKLLGPPSRQRCTDRLFAESNMVACLVIKNASGGSDINHTKIM